MIIDFRHRPPYGAFCDSFLFKEEAIEKYGKKFDVGHSEAIQKMSMELYEKEKTDAGIAHVVMQGTKGQNATMEQLVKQNPEAYSALVMVDLLDPIEECLDIIEKYAVNGIFKGVSMIPSFGHKLVDNESLFPIYEKCQETQTPLMIFSGGNSLINYEENSPIHVDNIAKTFPNLKLIVGHGCWPYVQEMCGVCYKRDNVYVCPDIYMFRTPGYQDFATAASWHLRERFLFGTSYPQVPLQTMVDWYHTCGIREEVLDNIFYGNAAKLLGIS